MTNFNSRILIFCAFASQVFGQQFQIYHYDSQNGLSNFNQGNRLPGTSIINALNEVLGNDPPTNYRPNNYRPSTYQPTYYQSMTNQPAIYQPQLSSSTASCGTFWSINNDFDGQYGIITVPDPNYKKSVIRAVLSLAAQLPTVSDHCYLSLLNAHC